MNMIWRRWSSSAVLACFCVAIVASMGTARAQPIIPIGGEQQVNTYTFSDQDSPDVGTDADGNFVATWESFTQDGDRTGVFAKRIARDGSVLGTEFQVNTYTIGLQHAPRLAVCGDGKFVIVWQSNPYGGVSPQDGDSVGVFAQRFAGDATPLGSEFQVNQYTIGDQAFPAVAKKEDGSFIVVWHSGNKLGVPPTGTQDGFSSGIFGRRYASDGTPQSDEFQVNSYTAAAQSYAEIAATPSGAFVVVWRSNGQEGSFGLFGQRFASDGSRAGEEFQVNTYTVGIQERPSVAFAPSGDFLVAWQSDAQDGQNRGVFAQLFAGDGSHLGSEFQVNAFTPSYQGFPDVSFNEQNGFIVTWQSFDQGGDRFDIFARRYASDGTPLTSEFQVNSYFTGLQERPVVATGPEEFSVIAWQSEGRDSSRFSVQAQRFGFGEASPVPLVRPLGLLVLILFLVAAGWRVLRGSPT